MHSSVRIGPPRWRPAGFDVALAVLAAVAQEGRHAGGLTLSVTWLCQELPPPWLAALAPRLDACGTLFRFYVDPPQVRAVASSAPFPKLTASSQCVTKRKLYISFNIVVTSVWPLVPDLLPLADQRLVLPPLLG